MGKSTEQKLNPSTTVNSRIGHGKITRTSRGDNFVGDTFGTGFDGPVIATGGTESTITDSGVSYKLHTFTGSGTFSVTRGGKIDFVLIAGGGQSHGGGGGGAGGMVDTTNYKMRKAAANYTVSIGGQRTNSSIAGLIDGSDISAHRGGIGGGGSPQGGHGGPGGSGGGGESASEHFNGPCNGGGGGSSTPFGPQGYGGGGGHCHNQCGYAPHGGGGGAGGGGSQGGGGGGRSSTITGSSQTYAAGQGGGGNCAPGNSPGGHSQSYGFGSGGSGVCYIRYRV